MADDNWTLVQDAILAFNMKVPDLAKARAALLKVLEAEAWKHYEPPIGKACEPQSFAEWVTGGIPRGLNTTVKNIKGYAAGADQTFIDALDAAMQQPEGAPTGNRNAAKGGVSEWADECFVSGCPGIENCDPDCMRDASCIAADPKTTVYNVHGCFDERPSGNRESAALRRLRKHRPDLHAQVLDGEVSAHAAAVKAGFRPKTFTIRADRAELIAATLRRQLNPEVLAMVTKLLSEEG